MVSPIVKQLQYFTDFRRSYQDLAQDPTRKKSLSLITTCEVVSWWVQTLVSPSVEANTLRARTTMIGEQQCTMLYCHKMGLVLKNGRYVPEWQSLTDSSVDVNRAI